MSFNLSSIVVDDVPGCCPSIEMMELLLSDDDLLQVIGGAPLASSACFAASSCTSFLCTHNLFLRIQKIVPISITTTANITATIMAAITPAGTPSEPVHKTLLH